MRTHRSFHHFFSSRPDELKGEIRESENSRTSTNQLVFDSKIESDCSHKHKLHRQLEKQSSKESLMAEMGPDFVGCDYLQKIFAFKLTFCIWQFQISVIILYHSLHHLGRDGDEDSSSTAGIPEYGHVLTTTVAENVTIAEESQAPAFPEYAHISLPHPMEVLSSGEHVPHDDVLEIFGNTTFHGASTNHEEDVRGDIKSQNVHLIELSENKRKKGNRKTSHFF